MARTGEIATALMLSSVAGLRMFGLFLLLPVFMVLARDVPEFTPALGGLAVGIYGLSQALLQQPFGWLSDRLGRRPVMLLGLALFASGGIAAAMAETIYGMIAGRALQGAGAISAVAMAWVIDSTRPEHRPVSMAIFGIGIGAAFILSILLSAPLATGLGLQGLFWLTAALAVMGMLITLRVPGPPWQGTDSVEFEAAHMPAIWLLGGSVFLLHALMTLLFVILPVTWVQEMGISLQQHWRLYVPAISVSVVITLPLLAWAGRRGFENRFLLPSFGLLALTMLVLPVAARAGLIAALLAAYFVAVNLLEASMPSLAGRFAGSLTRGRNLGIYSTLQFVGALCGGALGGLALQYWGARPSIIAASLLCLLWCVVLVWPGRRVFRTGRAI